MIFDKTHKVLVIIFLKQWAISASSNNCTGDERLESKGRQERAQKIKKALKQGLLYVLIISNQNYKILGRRGGSGD